MPVELVLADPHTTALDVYVDYLVVGGTATPGADYVLTSGTLIIPGGSSAGEVSVLISIGGPCFAGKASHTDVIKASAEAYMNALNSLASFRSDEASIQFVNEGIMQAFQGGEE